MKLILLLSLYFLVGCATKYIVPSNRFITPEAQGVAFSGQFEFQQTKANQLMVNTSAGNADEGVFYSDINRAGFLLSTSLFDQFDFYWSHAGTANSMLGGKYQFIGAPRTAKGAGHKMSLAVAFGGNEHETEDETIEFELSGKEVLLLYGYRINEHILPYTSFSYAAYDFTAKIKSSNPVLNGLEPDISTTVMSLSGGFEFTLEMFFAKLEATYQQLTTENSKDRSNLAIGYSIGLSW